jgi:glycine cleavage system P protein (glycine dehydrogenase) subunit 2
VTLRRYHAPVWDEPLVMELTREGRRGVVYPQAEPEVRRRVGDAASLLPDAVRRAEPPQLPELSEPDVLRHYLHLSQETLGMIGISLFGTCTMKYNPRVSEALASRPELAELHPAQSEETLQGVLELVHGLDRILCALSGMDRFVFQAGGGAHAAYTFACIVRAWLEERGELGGRDEVITTIQAHPCNAATAAAAGFKVVTLMLGDDGYPPVEALRAAVSDRTAALMVNNPDDMGIYNPNVDEWVRIVHEAGGLCFYDHANFNGVMGKIRARDLGFDACMYMLHKTFGAPKGGGGPAVGAFGCSEELEPYLPTPVVVESGDRFVLDRDRPRSIGKVREFWGNVPQVVKAYAWARAMGADGIHEASDLSVLANNYMERRLLEIPGLERSNPQVDAPRLEMTRYGFGKLQQETGIGVVEIANRLADYGIDGPWLSHEPWLVPEPITPEAGEMWSKEDLDYWIDALAQVVREAYEDPELVRTAPHNQVVHKLADTPLDDPGTWATTWRAYLRKHSGAAVA